MHIYIVFPNYKLSFMTFCCEVSKGHNSLKKVKKYDGFFGHYLCFNLFQVNDYDHTRSKILIMLSNHFPQKVQEYKGENRVNYR